MPVPQKPHFDKCGQPCPLELGLAADEFPAAVEAAFAEIRLQDYKEPDEMFDPPGHSYVWRSKRFGCQMYMKFRLEGRRPVCWLYSLHKADYTEQNSQ